MVVQPRIMHGLAYWGLAREKMKGNTRERSKEEIKKADLLDWLLAIDVSLP